MRRPQPQRAGFTLVELLVVVTIIIILSGLITAGVFRYLDTQMWANTQNKVASIHGVLTTQWNQVISDADKESVPPSVLSFAGNDQKRARVILRKIRLTEAFPMSAKEITSPQIYGYFPGLKSKYIPGYNKELASYGGTLNLPDPTIPFSDSSSCLYLALRRARTGTEVDMENLARDINSDGVKEFVDDWGNPIAFFRFPVGDNQNNPLRSANPAVAGSKASKYCDPLDPDGKLIQYPPPPNTWNTYRPQFESLFHKISITPGQPPAYYTVPVVVSAGADGDFGLAAGSMQVTGTGADDNIYSFNFRAGAGEAP